MASGIRAWLGSGDAVVQPFPNEVCVEQHESHECHPAAELGHEQAPDDLGDAAVEAVKPWHQRAKVSQGLHRVPGLQQARAPGDLARAAGRRRGLRGNILQRGAIQNICLGGCLLCHKERGQHTAEEDDGKEAEEAGLLPSQVRGQKAAPPVNGWKEVADAAPQADHEGIHGESLAAVVWLLEEV